MVGARVEAEGEEGQERRGEPDLCDCKDGTPPGSRIAASGPSVSDRISAETAILR